jgi:trehalose-6-phosphatase
VGDDVTDESVFAAMPALGGFGFSAGREVAGVAVTFDADRHSVTTNLLIFPSQLDGSYRR